MVLFGSDGNPIPQYRMVAGFHEQYEEIEQVIQVDEAGRVLADCVSGIFLDIAEDDE